MNMFLDGLKRSGLGPLLLLTILLAVVLPLSLDIFRLNLVGKYLTYGFVAIGSIIGGALGNLHDRLFRQLEVFGELKYGVVDFIQIYYIQGSPAWPNFNIADVALVVGVVLLIPYLMFHAEPRPTATATTA